MEVNLALNDHALRARLLERVEEVRGAIVRAAGGALSTEVDYALPDKGITEIWHRSGFDIDEDALPVGVEIMSLAALHLLQ